MQREVQVTFLLDVLITSTNLQWSNYTQPIWRLSLKRVSWWSSLSAMRGSTYQDILIPGCQREFNVLTTQKSCQRLSIATWPWGYTMGSADDSQKEAEQDNYLLCIQVQVPSQHRYIRWPRKASSLAIFLKETAIDGGGPGLSRVYSFTGLLRSVGMPVSSWVPVLSSGWHNQHQWFWSKLKM